MKGTLVPGRSWRFGRQEREREREIWVSGSFSLSSIFLSSSPWLYVCQTVSGFSMIVIDNLMENLSKKKSWMLRMDYYEWKVNDKQWEGKGLGYIWFDNEKVSSIVG